MGCQLRAPEPSVTLVNSVKLGTFQVQKSKIAQKDGSEIIRRRLPGLSPRAMRRRRSSRGTTSPGAAWRGCFGSTAFLKASGKNFDRSDAAKFEVAGVGGAAWEARPRMFRRRRIDVSKV